MFIALLFETEGFANNRGFFMFLLITSHIYSQKLSPTNCILFRENAEIFRIFPHFSELYIIFAENRLYSAKYSSKLDIVRSFALSLH